MYARYGKISSGSSVIAGFSGRTAMLVFFAFILTCYGCTKLKIPSSSATQKPAVNVSAAKEEKPAGPYYDYMIAELALKKGDMDTAFSRLESVVKKDPDALLPKEELALLYLQKDRKKDALFLADDILAKAPDNVEALIISGSIRQSLGDLDGAKEAYKKVLSIDPGRKNIYVVLGRLYLADKDFDSAIDLFSRMVKKFKDSYAGFYYLGKAYAGKKEIKKSEAAFLKALSIDSSLMEPRVELIGIYKKTGDIKSEIRQYEAILKAYPENVVAAVDLGLLYTKTGDTRKAAALFRSLGEKSLNDTLVADVILKNLIAQKRIDDALTVLQSMSAGAPDSDDIRYLSGLCFYSKKDYNKALSLFLAVGKDSRFYIDALVNAAVIYNASDNVQAGINLLNPAFDAADDKDRLRLAGFLSAFYEKEKDYVGAEAVLKKAIDIAPDNPDLHYSLGIVLDKKGDFDAALKEMKTVIRLAPDHADALNYIGYTYADKGIHLDEAEKLVKKALSLKKDNGYIQDSMAWVYYKKGKLSDALTYIEKAVENVPDDPVILEHLGDIYTAMKQRKKAIESYERALSLKNAPNRKSLEKKIDAVKKLSQSQGFNKN